MGIDDQEKYFAIEEFAIQYGRLMMSSKYNQFDLNSFTSRFPRERKQDFSRNTIGFGNQINLKSQWLNTINVCVLLKQIQSRSMVWRWRVLLHTVTQRSKLAPQESMVSKFSMEEKYKAQKIHTFSFMQRSNTCYSAIYPLAGTSHKNLPNTKSWALSKQLKSWLQISSLTIIQIG